MDIEGIENIIHNRVCEIKDEIIEWRRYLHQYPELGFDEKNSSSFVFEKLKSWGIETKKCAITGVVGLIKGKPGKTIALRADLDALPIKEMTLLPYSSKNPGKMHACGHDGHTAIVLGAAKVLSQLKDKLTGNIKLIFQPAEEGPGGAEPMIKEGVLTNPAVDAIVGLHIRTSLPSGKIGIKSGKLMAAPDEFKIRVIGKGTHAAHPDQGIDPIIIASQIVLALQNLVSRETDPTEPALISCGTFQAGSKANIIPGEAVITGTVRTLSSELRTRMRKRIEELVAGITGASKAKYEFEYKFEYPPLVNDDKMAELARKVSANMPGKNMLFELKDPSMGGEDFAYYLKKIPGVYVFLGNYNPDKDTIYPIHSPNFKIDEDVLPLGTEFLARMAFNYLFFEQE